MTPVATYLRRIQLGDTRHDGIAISCRAAPASQVKLVSKRGF